MPQTATHGQNDRRDDGHDEAHCGHCGELHAEIERLRARLARAEADRAALARTQADRDYERPPHYR